MPFVPNQYHGPEDLFHYDWPENSADSVNDLLGVRLDNRRVLYLRTFGEGYPSPWPLRIDPQLAWPEIRQWATRLWTPLSQKMRGVPAAELEVRRQQFGAAWPRYTRAQNLKIGLTPSLVMWYSGDEVGTFDLNAQVREFFPIHRSQVAL